MAATRAAIGYKSQLQRGDGATPTETFTTVAEVQDITGPSVKRSFEDVTNMDSPNSFVEMIPTLLEAGEVTFNCNFVENDPMQLALRSDLLSGTKRNFRLVTPTGLKRFSFTGYVAEMGNEWPVKGKMATPVKIQITGWVSFEANS